MSTRGIGSGTDGAVVSGADVGGGDVSDRVVSGSGSVAIGGGCVMSETLASVADVSEPSRLDTATTATISTPSATGRRRRRRMGDQGGVLKELTLATRSNVEPARSAANFVVSIRAVGALRLVAHALDGRAADTVAPPELRRRHLVSTAPTSNEVSSRSLAARSPV